MHGTCHRVQGYIETLIPRLETESTEVVVCVPFILLPVATMIATGSSVAIGAQNCHWKDEGAFTGEIAAPMLAELGVGWVIVGHSERRRLFGESDETASERARAAQRANLSVIYCLGESLDQRESGVTLDVLRDQSAFLDGLDPQRLAVAYEPVWAIGTGHNATPEQAQQAHEFLRQRCASLFGDGSAADIRIIYGGSVNAENAPDIFSRPDVDGGLVGGASLDAEAFSVIIHSAPSG
jgi:triosephosphate isomerase